VVHGLVWIPLQRCVADDSKLVPKMSESCHGGHREAQKLEMGQTQSVGVGHDHRAPYHIYGGQGVGSGAPNQTL
jgi:hypothetical protein